MPSSSSVLPDLDLENLPPMPNDDLADGPVGGVNTGDPEGDEDFGFDELDFDDAGPPRGGNFGGFGGGLPGMGPGLLQRGRQRQPELDIPMWAEVHLKASSGEAFRLRVQRQTDDATKAHLGYLAADASIRALINKWQKPGVYWVTPVNEVGKSMRSDPYRVEIDPDHDYLRHLLSKGAEGSNGGGNGSDTEATYLYSYMLEQQRIQSDNRDKEQARNDAAQARHDERATNLATAEAALAGETNKNAATIYSAQAERDAKRSTDATNYMTGLFAESRQKDGESHDREIERQREAATARSGEQKSFFEGMLAMGQTNLAAREMDLKEQRQRDDKERLRQEAQAQRLADERKADAKEREVVRREDADRREKRDREHYERLHAVDKARMESSNPFTNVLAIAATAAPLLALAKEAGFDIPEAVKGMFAGNSAKGIAGEIGETLRTAIETAGQMAQGQMGGAAGPVQPQWVEVEVDEHGNPLPGQLPGAMPGQLPGPVAGGATEAAAGAPEPEQPVDSGFGGPAAMADLPPRGTAGDQPPVGEPPTMSPSTPAAGLVAGNDPTAGLDAQVKKKARRGLRNLVAALEGKEEAEWGGIAAPILMPIGGALEVYLRAKGLKPAALEAGASAEMADRVIAMMDAAEMYPDVPREAVA